MRRSLPFLLTLLAASAFAYAPAPKGVLPRLQLVSATHPSGLFTTNASVTFTNNAAQQTASIVRDAVGNITQRLWRNPDGSTNLTQDLVWDARDRLSQVTEKDSAGNGYVWIANYDGLNRRVLSQYYTMTNGVVSLSWPQIGYTVIKQFYDPLVEFLELGVSRGTETEWKLCGPDLSGRYGGMNGTGGLEAVASGPSFTPVIGDMRGNVLGTVTNGSVSWNAARPTGYGAAPGRRPVALWHGAGVAQASAWRGRWPDIMGTYHLGMRDYDPIAGMWLSYDPAWNERDPNYLTFAGGDPINRFDPDGRFGKGAFDFAYNGGAGGQALTGLGNYLNDYTTDNALLAAMTGFGGSLSGTFGAAVTPSTYVNTAADFGTRLGTLDAQFGHGMALSYGLTSWNVGAIGAGMMNVDYYSGQPVGDWYQRGALISSGVAGTATVGAGALGVYNWATAPAVPPVLAAEGNFVTLYHQGQLQNGMVSGTRPLSTSLSSDLSHYNPGAPLNQFNVPQSTFLQWQQQQVIREFLDLHASSQILTPEIRILPPASGQLNQFLVPPTP